MKAERKRKKTTQQYFLNFLQNTRSEFSEHYQRDSLFQRPVLLLTQLTRLTDYSLFLICHVYYCIIADIFLYLFPSENTSFGCLPLKKIIQGIKENNSSILCIFFRNIESDFKAEQIFDVAFVNYCIHFHQSTC